MAENKKILRALAGEVLETPPIWMMRQAGRYLPEYRATRAEAGDFLSLCYNSELAAEVTLQPIRRYGFDAAILFADILLLPQALGADLWFVTGEGPRLSTLTKSAEFDALKPVSAIHKTLDPVYETVRILSKELPAETTLIGFAGAPWTVATYMIAGRGTPDQAPAHALKRQERELFERLIDLLTDATIEYLSAQIDAGAEVVKLFDSWAGSLRGDDFKHYALAPARRITQALKQRHPQVPVIAFPREAGDNYIGFAKATMEMEFIPEIFRKDSLQVTFCSFNSCAVGKPPTSTQPMDVGVDGKSGDAKCLSQYDACGLVADARECLKFLKGVRYDSIMVLNE